MKKEERVVHDEDEITFKDVKVGEFVDQGAGCFLELTKDGWIQWDGGYGLEVPESEVIKWLN